jgi:probable HAF family extracellular repeat protein
MVGIGALPVGFPGSTSSSASSINASGQVTGSGGISGSTQHAFLWTPAIANGASGTIMDLGTLPGATGAAYYGGGINDVGQVIGGSIGGRAFLWTPNVPNAMSGAMIDLGTLPGHSSSYAEGINAAGQIAGASIDAAGKHHAFLWTPNTHNGTTGAMIDLGTLPAGTGESRASDINTAGQVVGLTPAINNPNGHAFLWTPTTPNGTSGSMIDLGDLPGGADYSYASAINNAGQVTGTSSNIAFLWTPIDGMLNLNNLLDASGAGWLLQQATDVNDAGQIVGLGTYDPDGPGGVAALTHGFLLIPVPEPSSVGVLSLVLIARVRLLRRNS